MEQVGLLLSLYWLAFDTSFKTKGSLLPSKLVLLVRCQLSSVVQKSCTKTAVVKCSLKQLVADRIFHKHSHGASQERAVMALPGGIQGISLISRFLMFASSFTGTKFLLTTT